MKQHESPVIQGELNEDQVRLRIDHCIKALCRRAGCDASNCRVPNLNLQSAPPGRLYLVSKRYIESVMLAMQKQHMMLAITC